MRTDGGAKTGLQTLGTRDQKETCETLGLIPPQRSPGPRQLLSQNGYGVKKNHPSDCGHQDFEKWRGLLSTFWTIHKTKRHTNKMKESPHSVECTKYSKLSPAQQGLRHQSTSSFFPCTLISPFRQLRYIPKLLGTALLHSFTWDHRHRLDCLFPTWSGTTRLSFWWRLFIRGLCEFEFGFWRDAVLHEPWRPSLTKSLNGCCIGGTVAIFSRPRRPSFIGTLYEIWLCRGTLHCTSRRPSFPSRLYSCCSQSLWTKRAQLHRHSLRVPALSWHSALQFQEAELSQQTSPLLRRRHCSCHMLWAKRAPLHQRTLSW